MNSKWLLIIPLIFLYFLAGCSFSRQLMPLAAEDEKALAFSKTNRSYLDKSGAVMAFEEFAAAVRDGDAEGCVARLGPTTLALLKGRAAEARRTPVELWRAGDIPGIVLPGTGKPVSLLKNRTTVAEMGQFNPSRREVTLLANVEGAGETRIKAAFTERGWVLEFVDSVPAAPL